MTKRDRGEEHDTTTHLIKIQVFTHTSRVTNFSVTVSVRGNEKLLARWSLSTRRLSPPFLLLEE